MIKQIQNLIYRYERIFMGVILFLVLMAIGFRFDSSVSTWFWSSYPFIAILLVLLSLAISLIWVRAVQSKLEMAKNQIKQGTYVNEKMVLLSNRQLEVFQLIAAGKSNKEITQELHIELSTLKTHINHIYKLLEITNRRELRHLAQK